MLKTSTNNHNLKVTGGGGNYFFTINNYQQNTSKKLILQTLLALFLISCGGGGGSSSSSNNNQTLITEITITGDAFILSGTTTTLTATIIPENASNQNLNWSSSNEEVATVTNGLVTALSAGTATITATSQDNSDATASILITVQAEAVLITEITINSTKTITVGNTSQLTTTITPNNATNQNLTWSSSNEEIATVDNTGLVTALSAGETNITAAATDGSGVTRSTNITIEPIYITTINLDGNNIITVGDETTLTATITPNDATNQNLNWSSSDNNIATVTNGLVTALNSGTVTITATATDGSGVTARFTIITGKAPTINNTEFYININTAVDTILGNLNIKNNPESLRILEHPDGDHNYFSIDNDNNLVLTNELTTTKTSIITITAANQFGTTNENITINITTISQIAKLIANDSANANRFGTSVAIYNDYMLIGATGPSNANIPGYAYLFRINETTREVTGLAKLIAADGANYDRFGASVALNDNYALIGADRNDHSNLNNNGAAYLFAITNIVPNTTITHTTKLVANDGNDDDRFGISVALNNNYALIGAWLHDHSILADNGAAYLFDITNIVPNTIITHTTKLIANDSGEEDYFGISVALNNNYALISATSHDHSNLSNNGAAYLFDITDITPNTTITHTTKLIANDSGKNDYFGISVALNNNYALIGAWLHDHSNLFGNGAAYLFDITGIIPNTTITHTTKLIANDGGGGDNFGRSVALNNNYALIGANFHDHSNLADNGAAYLFDITNITPNTTINHTTKLVANDGESFDNFGRSVALNNNYALIGANLHDHSNLADNGAAYVFDL